MQAALGISLGTYLAVVFGIVVWARTRVHDEKDFIVAGRRLPLGLSTFTLFATWFGAGTLISASDEIYAEGLQASAMEPYGAGVCLILVGLFFASPLWKMKLCTVADFSQRRFGKKAEAFVVLSVVPGYVGWIAVQLVALQAVPRSIMEAAGRLPPVRGKGRSPSSFRCLQRTFFQPAMRTLGDVLKGGRDVHRIVALASRKT